MGKKSMQGTPWHVVNSWQLKEKDEFAWEVKESIKKDKPTKVKKGKIFFEGNFIIKFEGEEPKQYIIGKNVSKDADIVKRIYYSNIGETILINGEKVLIVEKNIR